MDFSFMQQLDYPYAGFPLWMWITGGAVVAGVGYHFYRAKKTKATSNTTAGGTQDLSNQFNYPQTLDQASQTGSLDATVAQLPPQDYWPYNQLIPMSGLSLPSYPGALYNPMQMDSSGQRTQVLYG